MIGPFGNLFPYTNFHGMNTDWLIGVAKDFLDNYSDIEQIIENGEQDINNIISRGISDLNDKKTELEGLLDAWYTEHSEDIAGELASALEDLNAWYTEHSTDIETAVQTAAAQATTQFAEDAADIVEDVLQSIPDDYSALGAKVNSIVYSEPAGTKVIELNSSDFFEQGAWTYGAKTVSSTRIRSKFAVFVYKNASIVINNPVLKILYGRLGSLESNSYAQGGTYINPSDTPTAITASYDGWIVINAMKTDETSITPSDWSGTITIKNPVNESNVLKERALLSSGDDVHDVKTNGVYYVSSASVDNWPFDDTGVLVVLKSGNQPGMYIAMTYQGQAKYQYFSSGYSNWFDLETSATVLQKTPALGSSDSCDTYTQESGVWFVGSASATNWPFNNTGVLIVLKSGFTPLIQLACDYTNNLKIRYKSVDWTSWKDLYWNNYKGDILSGNIDEYLAPGEYTVPSPGAVTNWPSSLSGRLINFSNPDSTTRIVQMAVDYQLNTYIRYKSATLTPWTRFAEEPLEEVIQVKADGTGDYTTVEDAVKYAMDEYFANKHYYKAVTIIIDAGTYDLSGVADMIAAEEVPVSGLYLPPHCKIIGQGKDATNLVWRYAGNSDDIMSNCSALNGSYDSEIRDLSITVKNLRYCIHSAQNHPDDAYGYSVDNPRINDTTIKYVGLKLVHEGFDTGITPTYAAPTPYGSGSWNGNKKIFIDCDFISATYSGWLNHNRKELTRGNYFYFENCTFRTKSVALDSTGAGANFISWTSYPTSQVIFKNCSTNKFICITIRTDETGDPNAISAYQISADTDMIVLDSTTNNVHTMDTWRTGEYMAVNANGNITAYQPVSFNALTQCRAYNSADPIWGIALNSATTGNPIIVKTSGRFVRSLITSTNFSAGKKIKYDTATSTWVEDNDNPMMIVTSSNILKMIPKY